MNQPKLVTDLKDSVKKNANMDLAVKSVMGAAFVGLTIFGLKKIASVTGFKPLNEAVAIVKGAK